MNLSKHQILQYLKEYKKEKSEKYAIKELGLFGSYARDEANKDSDIDIVVDFCKPDLLNQIGMMQELKLYFKTNVDVIALWKKMNPKLKKRIERDVIYV
jgi:predicted nucleotidyltransferase